jgi:hypothetical protein
MPSLAGAACRLADEPSSPRTGGGRPNPLSDLCRKAAVVPRGVGRQGLAQERSFRDWRASDRSRPVADIDGSLRLSAAIVMFMVDAGV